MSDPNPNPNPPNPNTPPPDAVTMTQAELDALISGRVGAALAAAAKKAPAVPDTVQKELDDLRAKEKAREQAELERKGEYTKALENQATSIKAEYEPKITGLTQQVERGTNKLREVIVTNALLTAAAEGNAIAPAQVVALLNNRVKLNDDLHPVVYDENGNPAFVGDKAMTPAQLVEGFLKGNPHFVKAVPGQSQHAKGGATVKGEGADQGELAAKQAEVEGLEKEVLRTGSPKAVAAHAKAVRELKALKAKAA